MAGPAPTATVELTIGHSPDADDAFMWWPLGTAGFEGDAVETPPTLAPAIDTGRYRFRPIAQDIETLNRRAVEQGDLDITAMSLHAYGHACGRYVLTASGASMGEGYGPKVLARSAAASDPDGVRRIVEAGGTIFVPGTRTSAFLTLSMLLGEAASGRAWHRAARFDEAIPLLLGGEVEAALVIHEAQVTYAAAGLHLLVDLGAWWADETGGLPMPLGVNALRRDLDDRFGPGTTSEVAAILRRSIEHAVGHRAGGLAYARAFAADRTTAEQMDAFVDLYVTDRTLDLGADGLRAIDEMLARGRTLGLVPAGPPAEVVGGPGRS